MKFNLLGWHFSFRYSESRSRGSSRRGSAAEIQSGTLANHESAAATAVPSQFTHKLKKTFSYWMKMTWDPEVTAIFYKFSIHESKLTGQLFTLESARPLNESFLC